MRQKENSTEIQSVDDLLAKIRAGTKEVHEIKIRELVVPVRILSIDEFNNIRKDAIKNTIMAKGDEIDKNVLVQKITLKLASTITKGGGPILSDKLLSMLTTDEVNYLYNEYIAVNERVNPSVESIDPEVFRELVDALKKNTITAKDLSLHQLRAICSCFQDLIQRPDRHSSQQDN